MVSLIDSDKLTDFVADIFAALGCSRARIRVSALSAAFDTP